MRKHHRGADFQMNVRGLACNRGFQDFVKQFHRPTSSLADGDECYHFVAPVSCLAKRGWSEHWFAVHEEQVFIHFLVPRCL